MSFPRSAGLGLSIASVITALVLFCALLLLSTSPAVDQFRQLDTHLRYLEESSTLFQRALGLERLPESVRDVQPVAEGYARAGRGIDQTVADIYAGQGMLAVLRRLGFDAFNAIDATPVQLLSTSQALEQADTIGHHAVLLETLLPDYLDQRFQWQTLREEFLAQSRELVRAFRASGRETIADQVYAAASSLSDLHVRDVDAADAEAMLRGLSTQTSRLAVSELAVLNEMSINGALLKSQAQELVQREARLELVKLISATQTFRARMTDDYLGLLVTVNDARVLLNLYTVLLLCVLVYFGARLQWSFRALNRSHDQLEERVQERTADLEQAMDNLKESQVQLVQAEKMSSLGQLVAGVMHEINTPLLYVQNNTTISAELVREIESYVNATLPIVAAQNAGEAKEAVQHMLSIRDTLGFETIRESLDEVTTLSNDSVDGLNQISELVQSLKDFSRIDRAAEDLFDVREGIEKTLVITRNLLKYGITVEKHFEDVPRIPCAPSRLNQVFINLVTNAVQAMDGEGTLRISTKRLADCVEVVFEDTGCGIPEALLNKVMDPFFTTKPVGQGTGLGLSIVRQIMDEHGGQILIDSREGKGTRISLSFPIERKRADREEAAA